MIEVGEVYPSKHNGDFEVVYYKNAHFIKIKFLKCQTVKIASSSNILRGEVSPKEPPNIPKRLRFEDILDRNDIFRGYQVLKEDKYSLKFSCPSCNNVLGKYKIFTGDLKRMKEGNAACYCKRMDFKNKEDTELIITNKIKDRGEFKQLIRKNSRWYIEWVCHKGHNNTSNHSDMLHKNSGCPECKMGCYDYLYTLLLEKDKQVFCKVGVTNNFGAREKMYIKDGVKIVDKKIINTTKLYQNNAYKLEQEILRHFRMYGIDDKSLMQGCVGYTETVPEYYFDTLVDILRKIEIQGDIFYEDLYTLITSN